MGEDEDFVDGAAVRTSTPEKAAAAAAHTSIDLVNAWSRSPLQFDLSSACTNRFDLEQSLKITFQLLRSRRM